MQNQILEVLICTINEGIIKVADHLLPSISYVKYLISWQQTEENTAETPKSLLERKDVKIVPLKGKGLAVNRNNAIQNATGDILVFSDDDTRYQPECFENILEAFAQFPGTDIITFQMADIDGKIKKRYSTDIFKYEEMPKGTYFSSVEIALRRTDHPILFDTRFGLGAEVLSCGEEEVYLHQAHTKGLKILYYPKVIAYTPQETTGTKFHTEIKVRRSKGAVLYLLHGYAGAVLRCFKFAIQSQGRHKLSYFKDMYEGIQYIRKNEK